MNAHVLDFFRTHYAPGRVCLVGSKNPIYMAIREAQRSLTKDGKASRYNHCFLMGNTRKDKRDDGSIYIFESDLHVSVHDWEVKNGVMESRIAKWCPDDCEYAAVLGMDLSQGDVDKLVANALWYAYDEQHLRYPVGELFGTLWALLTHRLSQKNIFDMKYAVQCSTFVRMCYRDIGREMITNGTDLTNTSPEAISQSGLFTFRKEWAR
jgi:hypothetical protein